MTKELAIVTATPFVTLTKAKRDGGLFVEVRASDQAEGLSIHYDANTEWGEVPTVQDRLLVAILSGVRPEWLNPPTNQPVEGGPVPITFEAVSAAERGGIDPVRSRQYDTLHISTVHNGLSNRLDVSMRDESGSLVHAKVVLSKGQVTSMLAALLAIYPHLEEE